MKKYLAMLLVILALLCATAMGETYEQFTYELREDGVAITGYTLPENPTAIQIPATIDGKPVVEIAARAFTDDEIKTISIPVSVKRIAGNAFYGCSKDLNLMVAGNHPVFAVIEGSLYEKTTRTLVVGLGPELKIPTGIQAIGDYACYGQYFTSLTVPATVKTIGAHAFQDASAPSFPLVEGVVSVGESAFRFFRATDDNLAFPSTLREVGKEAFYKTYLSSLTFNEALQVLGDGAFSNAIYKVGETRSSSSNHGSSCIEANSGEVVIDVTIPSGVQIGEGVFSELNTQAKKGYYSCKCDAYDRQLADLAAETRRILGVSNPDGVDTTVTGVVRFHYALGADAAVPAKLFEVTKKTKLSGNYEQDAWAELSSTSATILPKVRVVVNAPANAQLTIGNRSFAKCDEVTFASPVTLKQVGEGGFKNSHIAGQVALDPSITRWPFEGCTFETWTGIPEHITHLGSRAVNVTLTDEYLHANLVEIASDAFTQDSTFVVEPGSYAELWAMENNRLFSYASGGDDLSWLTGGEDDLSWLNPEGDALYNEALALEEAGDLPGAIALYEQVGDHRDALERLENCRAAWQLETDYQAALEMEAQGDYIGAYSAFRFMSYKDSSERSAYLKIKSELQKAANELALGKVETCIAMVEPYMETEPEAMQLFCQAMFRLNGTVNAINPDGYGWVDISVNYKNTRGKTSTVVAKKQYALMDCQGNVLALLDRDKIGDFKVNDWCVGYYLMESQLPYKMVYLDSQGQNVFGQDFKDAEDFHQGKALVTTMDGRRVVIDTTGCVVFEPPVKEGRTYVSYLGEGLISFTEKEKWGMMDLQGKVVLKPKYVVDPRYHKGIERFQYGMAVVCTNGAKAYQYKYGVIDAKGKEIVKPGQYYSLTVLGEDLLCIQKKKDEYRQITNLKGKAHAKSPARLREAERIGDVLQLEIYGDYFVYDLDLNVVASGWLLAVGYQSKNLHLWRYDTKRSMFTLWVDGKVVATATIASDEKIWEAKMSPESPYIVWQNQDKIWVIMDSEGNVIF